MNNTNMSESFAQDKTFEQWAEEYALDYEPLTVKDRREDCRFAFNAGMDCVIQSSLIANMQNTIDELTDANDLLADTLNSVANWCKAYPIEIFTEPNWEEVKEKLGPTLLMQVSGANMRHVVTGIQKIIDAKSISSPVSEKAK